MRRGKGRRRLGTFVASLLLMGGLAGPDSWQEHPYFALREIAIVSGTRLRADEIATWAGLREGMSVWKLSPQKVKNLLESHPWIRRAYVRRELPDRLHIAVVERRPRAILLLDDLYYLDARGTPIARLSSHDSRDLPYITGVTLGQKDRGSTALALRRALRLLSLLREVGWPYPPSEINLDRNSGVTLYLTGWPASIHLGWGRWRMKTMRILQVMRLWEGQEQKLAAIDARTENQVILRLGGDEGRRRMHTSI